MDEISKLRKQYKRQCYVSEHGRDWVVVAAMVAAVLAMILSLVGR